MYKFIESKSNNWKKLVFIWNKTIFIKQTFTLYKHIYLHCLLFYNFVVSETIGYEIITISCDPFFIIKWIQWFLFNFHCIILMILLLNSKHFIGSIAVTEAFRLWSPNNPCSPQCCLVKQKKTKKSVNYNEKHNINCILKFLSSTKNR